MASSQRRPNGAGVQVVARVSAADPSKRTRTGDDISISSRRVTLNGGPGGNESEYDLEFVFGPDSSEQDIFERNVNPMLRVCLEGVSVCILTVGASETLKTQTMDGIIPFAVEGLCQLVREKGKAAGASRQRGRRGGSMHATMVASYYEVYDEVLHDLLNPDNRSLDVGEDELHGVRVRGVRTAGPFVEAADLLNVFARGRENRTAAMSDFGPASQHASAVFQIDITQLFGSGDADSRASLRSKLLLVDVAGSEKLAEDAAQLRIREGPTLSKGILTLGAVATALSSAREADFAPYRDSKLTYLLSDALGGNSVAMAVACIRQGDPLQNLATMQLARDLSRVQNYPVVMDERAQGLLRRYRLEMARLRDEVAAFGDGLGGGGGLGLNDIKNDDDLAIKLNELEGRVIRDNLEKIKLREDKERVYEKLVQFRTKYNDLVGLKASVQEQLLGAEEEKLKISKALLDLQIENNQLVEAAEAEKYELVTKLLNAENDILEMQMKDQGKAQRTDKMTQALEDLKREKKELAMEFVTLKQNYVNLNKDLEGELTKNEELGLELLTLVNQKRALEAAREEAEGERDALQNEFDKVAHKLGDTDSVTQELEAQLRRERAKVEEIRAEKVRVELRLEKREVELESVRLNAERTVADVTKEREQEVRGLRKGGEGESRRWDAERNTMKTEIKRLETQLRQSERRMGQIETQLHDKSQQELRLAADNESLQQRMRELTEGYREKLLQFLSTEVQEGAAAVAGVGDALAAERRKAQAEHEVNREKEALLTELVDNYKSTERKLQRDITKLRAENQSVVRRNKVLHRRYTDIRHLIQDMDPQADIPEDPEDGARIRMSSVEKRQEKEILALKDALEQARSDASSSQEKAVSTAESFRKLVKDLEAKNSELSAELRLLERQKGRLMRGAAGDANSIQLEDMQRQMMEQMQAMQMQQPPPQAYGGGGGGDHHQLRQLEDDLDRERRKVRNMEEEMDELRRKARSSGDDPSQAEVRQMREENSRLQMQLSTAQQSSAAAEARATAAESRAAAASAAAAAAPAAAARSGGGGGGDLAQLQSELSEAERRAAELMTRNAIVEEELKNYQDYMKTNMIRYQREIVTLKKQMAFWKQKAVDAGVPPNTQAPR